MIWGMIHGIMNVLEDTVLPIRKCRFKWIGNLYTWIIAITAFVMFRADTAAYGWRMIRTMFTGLRFDLVSRSFLMEQLDGYTVVLIAGGILFSYPVTAKLLKCTGSLRDRYAAVWEVLKYLGVLVLLFLCVCSLAGAAYNPFIYFRF